MSTILSIFRWLLLAPFDFMVGLLAFPLAPLIVLLNTAAGVSPPWAWPWLTPDNPIDGDAGHLERWPDNGTRWRVFCRRVAWLWRNRGNGFSTRVTGLNATGPIRWWGDPQTSDNPAHAGFCFALCNGGWMLYVFWPWCPWLGLRIYLGWKLMTKVHEPDKPDQAMLVTNINPFKGYQ
ncbi:DUF7338 family protein [Aquitalea aquatilis]|uniref:DUF7338 family protein n=1 Tax=Aquitalea aquatilis TaxID=1537400 RepID=UPI0010BD4B83|nr:hypothetical protein [Aquitalea aquatilis]